MAYASWSVTFGEQPSAAKWNILGTNDASFNDGTGIATDAITPAKMSGVKLFGLGTNIVGTATTTATAFKIQSGSSILGTGYNTVTYPTAFPNGVQTVIVTNGDGDANAGTLYLKGSTVSLSTFQVASSAAGNYRCNWIAIGW